MILDNFTTIDGQLNWDAVIQQLVTLYGLYRQDSTNALRLMNLDGQSTSMVAFVVQPKSKTVSTASLPSYCIVRQGNNIFVSLYATNTKDGWADAFSAVKFKRDFNGSTAAAALTFYLLSEELETIIDSYLPSDLTDLNLFISGYGVGATCAFMASCLLKTRRPGLPIEIMTFGEPKTITEKYAGTEPDQHWRIVREDDRVPRMPPHNVTYGWHVMDGLDAYLFRSQYFAHFGNERVFFDTGKKAPNNYRINSNAINLVPRSSPFPVVQLSEYLEPLTKDWSIRPLGSREQRVWTIIADMKAGNQITPDLPAFDTDPYTDYPDISETLSAPGQNSVTPQSFPGMEGTLMRASRTFPSNKPGPVSGGETEMAIPSGYWRFTTAINNDNVGKSQSIVWKGTADIAAAIVQAEQWAYLKSNLQGADLTLAQITTGLIGPTGGTPMVQRGKVSDPMNPRISQPFVVSRVRGSGYGQQIGNSAADVFSTAVSMHLTGTSAQTPAYKSGHTETFLGNPDSLVKSTQVDNTVLVCTSPTILWVDALATYLTFITTPANGFGFMGIDNTIPVQTCTTWGTSTTGEVLLTIPGHGYQSEDEVEVFGQVPRIFSGNYKIAVVDANSFYLIGRPISGQGQPRTGKVRRVKTAAGVKSIVFYAFDPLTGEKLKAPFPLKVTKRNLSKKITGISFKRKAKRR